MFNKIYSSIIKFINKNKYVLFFSLVLILILNIPLPYYIETNGGLINLDKKIIGNNKINGSYNLTYVSLYKCNIFKYLYSFINKDYDLISINEYKSNESESDIELRNNLLLDNSISNAYYVASKYLNNNINIINKNMYVIYIDKKADTNLKVGDRIINIDGISNFNELNSYIKSKKVGNKLKVLVNNNEVKYVTVKKNNNIKSLYLYIINNYDYDSNIKLKFSKKETGPSGGLMISLFLYDKLNNYDLSKGRIIAGTGTIDINGNVGSISGIKYKIKGAKNSDIFFVPIDNYEDAKEVVNKNKYNMILVPVKNFKDAVTYLNK